MKLNAEQLKEKALDIVSFNKTFYRGGNKLKHETSAYGKVFKYIFAEREWTFAFVGELINTTGQNVNYIVNRMPNNRFSSIYLKKLCKKLDIDFEEFNALCNIIIEME